MQVLSHDQVIQILCQKKDFVTKCPVFVKVKRKKIKKHTRELFFFVAYFFWLLQYFCGSFLVPLSAVLLWWYFLWLFVGAISRCVFLWWYFLWLFCWTRSVRLVFCKLFMCTCRFLCTPYCFGGIFS